MFAQGLGFVGAIALKADGDSLPAEGGSAAGDAGKAEGGNTSRGLSNDAFKAMFVKQQ